MRTETLETIDIISSVDITEDCNKPVCHSVTLHEKTEIKEERAQELLFSLIRNESHPSRCLCVPPHTVGSEPTISQALRGRLHLIMPLVFVQFGE